MNEYVKQAKDFLKDCNANIDIFYLGTEVNKHWEDKQKRDHYIVDICTPKGAMQIDYWDSVNNTIRNYNLSRTNKPQVKPTEYDILSCLQKYDVGDIEDFMLEFDYKIEKKGDFKRIQNIYNAVIKEYQDICCCFTQEQIEKLREIM